MDNEKLLAEHEAAVRAERTAWNAVQAIDNAHPSYAAVLALWEEAAERAARLTKTMGEANSSTHITAHQIDEWAAANNTTRTRVCEAIVEVGYRTEAVRAYLARHPAGTHHGRSGHGAASIVPHLTRQKQQQTLPGPLEGAEAAK